MSSNGNAGGIEFSEAEVKPTKEEVEASPEKVAEIKEAAEVQRATDEATVTPESVKEKMEHAPAEDLMGALVEAVDAVPPPETPRAAQEDLNQGRPTESQSEGDPKAASEVQSVVSEVSTTAPDTTLEGSGKDDKVTIAETASEIPSRDDSPRTAESSAAEYLEEAGQPEMQESSETVPESEQAEQTQSAAVPDLETVERDDDETKWVKDGGDDDKFNPDDGLEQAGDIREDTDISNQYGDDVIETGDGVDTLRDPARAGVGIPDIPDLIPDLGSITPGTGGGIEPGDLGGPGVGLDLEGEREDLAGAAVFGGGDSRVGWTGETEMNDYMDSSGKQRITYNEHYENDDGSTTDIDTVHEDGVTTQNITHTSADGTTITETNTTGDGSDSSATDGSDDTGGTTGIDPGFEGMMDDSGDEDGGDDSDDDDDEEEEDDSEGGDRGPKDPSKWDGAIDPQDTPDPEGGEDVDFDPTTLDGKLRAQAFSNLSSVDQELGGEAVSQPVDEDSASPKEPGIVFDRETQTDPHSQDTVDGADVPSTGFIPDEKSKFTPGMAGGDDGVLDPDFGAVDPNKPTGEPDAGGDEGSLPNKPN